MNRPIKFRAWDKKTNDWIIFSIQELFAGVANGEEYDLDFSRSGQFTGLLDKNGTPIYEGDILKMDSWNPTNVQVAFIEGAFCLANKDGHYTGDIHYIQHADIPQASVIGNVHENPDLLK